MNPEILRAAHPHVRQEWERHKERDRVVSRAMTLAIVAYRNGVGREELPGSPPEYDAPLNDWIDYFLGQGVLELHPSLFHELPVPRSAPSTA